jgi:hypothetical protein
MKHTMGERFNIRFNGKIKLEFHGVRLTSDGGLLAYRELDEALGLFKSVSIVMSDKRTRRNIQHDMTSLLRQSVYTRLAGYEDVNDAQRLSVDPAMRAVTGKKKLKTRLRSSGILAGVFHKVDRGNIYSSDSICSDKTLHIRSKTKV